MSEQLQSPFKEFTDKGWPLCPVCEEDELYSYLMLTWTKPEPPSVDECIATGMKCYRCSWELLPSVVLMLPELDIVSRPFGTPGRSGG